MLREEVLPALLEAPPILDAYVGRHGPDEEGERVMSSIWESRAAMAAQLGDASDIGRYRPERAHEFTSSQLDVLPIVIDVRVERSEPPAVLRVFRGRIRTGELDVYVEEARRGTLADAATNEGLIALYLGTEPPSRFVTVSAWTGWPAIETATGGNTRRPLATRNAERIVSFDVAHYEILPDSTPPRGGAARPESAAEPRRAARRGR